MNYTASKEDRAAIIKAADAKGFIKVAPGAYLATSSHMIAHSGRWGLKDPGTPIEFAKWPYWLSTDYGQWLAAVSGAEDEDLIKALED